MASYLITLPILLLFAGAALGLLVRSHRTLRAAIPLGMVLFSLSATCMLLWQVWQTGKPVIFQVGAWAQPFGISLVADLLGAFMAMMAQLVLVMGIIYVLGSKDACTRYPAFLPLMLMLGAGLLAKKAVERGLKVPEYVKTSFAPGSRVVTEYLTKAGLLSSLEDLGF